MTKRRWMGMAGVACVVAMGCGNASAPGPSVDTSDASNVSAEAGGYVADVGVDAAGGADAGALDTASFVAAYTGSYHAVRSQNAPSATTSQETEPSYNIVATDAGGGAVAFQIAETCSFRAVSRGAFLAIESGQRCVGFPTRGEQFTSTGGTAQRDGSTLTLTIAGDYVGTTDDGQAATGTYTWTYTGRPR